MIKTTDGGCEFISSLWNPNNRPLFVVAKPPDSLKMRQALISKIV